MEFEIEYDVILEDGNVIHFREEGTNIIIGDCEFSFIRLLDGFRLTYYMNSVPRTQRAKDIKNIKITSI